MRKHETHAPPTVLETDIKSPLQQLLRNAPKVAETAERQVAPASLCVGCVTGVEPSDCVLVAVAGANEPLRARPMTSITADDVGRDAVIAFESGCLDRPIVIGLLGPSPFAASDDCEEITIRSDRLSFEGRREVVIRCGSASITLTESGRLLIKGDYVSSRATGTNRIRGGSVQIN